MCGRKNSLKRSGCTGNLIDSNKDSAELRSKWYRHKALIPAASLAKDLPIILIKKLWTIRPKPSYQVKFWIDSYAGRRSYLSTLSELLSSSQPGLSSTLT